MNIPINLKSFLVILCFGMISNSQAQVSTYSYTGALQTYTVPAGVTTIQIEANGAGGGSAGDDAFTIFNGRHNCLSFKGTISLTHDSL